MITDINYTVYEICALMGGASFFVLGAAWGQTEGHRGQKTRAGVSLSEVNPPPIPQ